MWISRPNRTRYTQQSEVQVPGKLNFSRLLRLPFAETHFQCRRDTGSCGSYSGMNCRTSSGESIFQSSAKTEALRRTISVRWSSST